MNKRDLIKALELVPDDVEISFEWKSIKTVSFDRPSNVLILSSNDINSSQITDWGLSGQPVIYGLSKILVNEREPRAHYDSKSYY